MKTQAHLNNPCLAMTKDEESSKEPCRPCTGDRSKRDEWSEGAVASLLDAYESKWVLRNRAKLKGQDWEDVARRVSSREGSTKPPKTQTQCKNKIESMKKRYRSESASANGSRWPFFPRLDGLMRCRGATSSTTPLMRLDRPPIPPSPSGTPHDSAIPNGVIGAAQEECAAAKVRESSESNKVHIEEGCSTPSDKEKKKRNKNSKRKEGGDWEVMESIQWLAEVALRVEQARMDTMRDLERMRVQTEARKGELDLKRAKIVANTQVQIVRILLGKDEIIELN